MNGPASTFPTGLLGLFGIKNNGRYPQELNQTYQPTLDMVDWLARANALELVSEQLTAFTGIGEKGNGNLWLVPSGQVWLLKGAVGSVQVQSQNTLIARLAIATRRNNLLFTHTFGEIDGWAPIPYKALTGDYNLRAPLNGPVFMMPGDELVLQVTSALANVGDFQPFLNGFVYKFTT